MVSRTNGIFRKMTTCRRSKIFESTARDVKERKIKARIIFDALWHQVCCSSYPGQFPKLVQCQGRDFNGLTKPGWARYHMPYQ